MVFQVDNHKLFGEPITWLQMCGGTARAWIAIQTAHVALLLVDSQHGIGSFETAHSLSTFQ